MAKKKSEKAPEEVKEEKKTVEAEETAEPEKVEESAPEAEKVSPLAEELAAEKDKYLRLYAEYDNYRKRSQKEREALFTDVKCDTISQLLPVYDNLERALKAECSDAAFFKGVEMTMTQLKEVLNKLGVSEIESVGTVFDPNRHNAVMHIDDENYKDGEIVEEFQKGFIHGDKVIRFSVVKVAN